MERGEYQILTEGNLESVAHIFLGLKDKHATSSKVHLDRR